MAKTIVNKIEDIQGRGQYTVEGEGARRHGIVNVTMTDQETTSVNREVHEGGLIDGSNSPFKNRPALGSDLCKGIDLEDAVYSNYARHGHTVVDGVRYVKGCDHAFRWSPTDPEVVQTYNTTIDETDHRFGWRDSFRVKGRVPSMNVHKKAEPKKARKDAGSVHRTTGVEAGRNNCLIQQRNEGALIVKKA